MNETNEVALTYYVSWLPGMSAVKLDITCKYNLPADAEALARFDNQIWMFGRNVKEYTLQEIANKSVKHKLGLSPPSTTTGLNMYHGDMDQYYKLDVTDHDDTSTTLDIDQIEKIIRDDIWKNVSTASVASHSLNVCKD